LTAVNVDVNILVGRTVIFYRTADGKCPMREFLDSLPAKAAQKAAWVLSLIEDLDVVPSMYFKKLVTAQRRSGSAGYSVAQMHTGYFASSTVMPLWS